MLQANHAGLLQAPGKENQHGFDSEHGYDLPASDDYQFSNQDYMHGLDAQQVADPSIDSARHVSDSRLATCNHT